MSTLEFSTYQISPTTIHASHLSFSSHPRRLICDALRARSDSRFWTLITVPLTHSIVPRHLYLGHTSTLEVVFLKEAGIHAHKKSTCSSTYSLIQDSTSVCSTNTQGSFSHLDPRKGVHFLLPYLLTALHDPITGIVTRLVRPFTNSSYSFIRLPPTMGHLDGAGFCAAKDIDWAEASIMSCAGRPSSSRSLRFIGEDDDDACRRVYGYTYRRVVALLFNIH